MSITANIDVTWFVFVTYLYKIVESVYKITASELCISVNILIIYYE